MHKQNICPNSFNSRPSPFSLGRSHTIVRSEKLPNCLPSSHLKLFQGQSCTDISPPFFSRHTLRGAVQLFYVHFQFPSPLHFVFSFHDFLFLFLLYVVFCIVCSFSPAREKSNLEEMTQFGGRPRWPILEALRPAIRTKLVSFGELAAQGVHVFHLCSCILRLVPNPTTLPAKRALTNTKEITTQT